MQHECECEVEMKIDYDLWFEWNAQVAYLETIPSNDEEYNLDAACIYKSP